MKTALQQALTRCTASGTKALATSFIFHFLQPNIIERIQQWDSQRIQEYADVLNFIRPRFRGNVFIFSTNMEIRASQRNEGIRSRQSISRKAVCILFSRMDKKIYHPGRRGNSELPRSCVIREKSFRTAQRCNIYDGGGVDGCKRAALDGSVSHEYSRKAIPKMMIAAASRSSLARLTVGNRSVPDARSQLPGIMSVRVPQDPPSSCTPWSSFALRRPLPLPLS